MQNRLRDLREDNDLTQAEVGKILNMRQSEYGRYERGLHMMGIDKYIKLAEYYNVSIDYLVGLVPTPKPLSEKLQAKKEKEKLYNAFCEAPPEIQKGIKMILKIKE